jgi:hypothetical protein
MRGGKREDGFPQRVVEPGQDGENNNQNNKQKASQQKKATLRPVQKKR